MRVLVVSDIHYACAAEQARRGHELDVLDGRIARRLLALYRDVFWLKNPLGQNHLLDQFLGVCGEADLVVANGDYSCNTAFTGVGDDAACRSAHECLDKLRKRFGRKFHATFGDHELGKMSLFGGRGGVRLHSWNRAISELCLEPFWTVHCGNYIFVGVVSTLIAFPVFEPESLVSECDAWLQLRREHLNQIRTVFKSVQKEQKLIMFCHDPTALPFLWREPEIRSKLAHVDLTIIGHLHSRLIFWKSKLLAGMPRIAFLGNSVRRFSTALHEARYWKDFNVQLCPSLAGIELLKDGGFLSLELDSGGSTPARVNIHRIHR